MSLRSFLFLVRAKMIMRTLLKRLFQYTALLLPLCTVAGDGNRLL